MFEQLTKTANCLVNVWRIHNIHFEGETRIVIKYPCHINPLETNGLSHPYQLDESTFVLRGIRSDFSFLFHFSMKIMLPNRIAPDGTPLFAVSHLGLICLPISNKKDARLKWVTCSILDFSRL